MFNVLACAYGLLYFAGDTVRDWIGDTAALVLNVLVGDTFVICWGIDGMRPDVLIRRRLLAPRAASQAQIYVT